MLSVRLGTVSIMLPVQVNRLTVQEAGDRYVELVRAKTVTGALSAATAEVYARDVATFVRLAGPDRVLDDLTGEDVDAVLLAFARKPDERRKSDVQGKGTGKDGGKDAGQSAASQARFRRSVSALFRHATSAGWVHLDPMAASSVVAALVAVPAVVLWRVLRGRRDLGSSPAE
ncbi:hypothetical protein B1L11_39500, partial [Microbispora sp. GKU 823]